MLSVKNREKTLKIGKN